MIEITQKLTNLNHFEFIRGIIINLNNQITLQNLVYQVQK